MTLAYFLMSNEAILDVQFSDDNLLTSKGIDIEDGSFTRNAVKYMKTR